MTELQTLTAFFMWCTIINGALLLLWISLCAIAPDLVYKTQKLWFPLPRDTFDIIIYAFLGLFKIIYLVFNVTPYVALLLIS